MAYYALPIDAAKRAYYELAQSMQPEWHELRRTKGSGEPKTYGDLKEAVDELRHDFTFPLADGDAALFEGLIGVLLHESIID